MFSLIWHLRTDLASPFRSRIQLQLSAQESTDDTLNNPTLYEDYQKENNPHRTHYRILYNEVAIPFYELTNSKDILIVLLDVIESECFILY